ncbi:50S ribosomal protein L21 [Enterobacterales bacterium endosymbiont of Anomoneura mori]|uniref:50S ribosomal protein L21 n=1 Tax=Enterobacterales bacterium endosymbiont of Anomoneura mori TaxID=3132096 RepID=UPI00399CF4E1
MYAIVENGGKQYKVEENKILCIEKINDKIGNKIKLKKILLFVNNKYIKIGKPFINNIIINAEIINHIKDIKKKIIKFKRRKHQKKHLGHRQKYTIIKIIKILKI